MDKKYLRFYLISDRKGKGGAQVYFEDLIQTTADARDIVFDLKSEGLFALVSVLFSRRNDIRYVSAHSSIAVAIGRVLCRMFSIKFYATIHGWSFKRSGKLSLEYLMERILVFFGGTNVCVSNDDKVISEELGYKNSRLLLNYGRDCYIKGSKADLKSVVMVARNSKQKDYQCALLLADAMPDYRFTFVGKDVPLLRLNGRIPGNVTLLEHTSKLDAILSKSNFFLLLSFYEGLPLSALEALSCNCILLLSDVGGNREIFNKGAVGLLIGSNSDTEAIKEYMEANLYLEGNNRSIWKNHFSFGVWKNKVLSIYG